MLDPGDKATCSYAVLIASLQKHQLLKVLIEITFYLVVSHTTCSQAGRILIALYELEPCKALTRE